MNVAVTGANGLVGAHLVKALASAGHRVIAVSRSAEPGTLMAIASPAEYTYIAADVCDTESMEDAFRRHETEIVFHCAVLRWKGGDASHPEKGAHWRTNVDGTISTVRAAAKAGASGFVHSSAMMVFDLDAPGTVVATELSPVSPQEPNGLSVCICEHWVAYLAEACGLQYAILRYPGIYGPGKQNGFVASCIRCVLSDSEQPPTVQATRKVDFLWVGDAVQANVLVLSQMTKAAGQVFHIGSGTTISLQEAAATIGRCAGKTLGFREATPPLPERDFRLDCTKAQSILGYRPHSFEHGVRESLSSWY